MNLKKTKTNMNTGDLILGASINDEMMTTTCGGKAMWAHDQGLCVFVSFLFNSCLFKF